MHGSGVARVLEQDFPAAFQGHWSNFMGSIEPMSLYEFCGYEMIDR